MIVSKSTGIPYYTYFTNSKHEFFADAPPAKGGSDAGFRPHELLEASLACCLNMWLRMYADKNGIELPPLEIRVSIDRDRPEEAVFNYSIVWLGPIEPEMQKRLSKVAETCSVRQMLSRRISFHELEER
jgi:putative redox protein